MLEVGADNQNELAQMLDYKSGSAISNWKTRGIDWNRIAEKIPSLDVNFVKTGERTIVNQSGGNHEIKNISPEMFRLVEEELGKVEEPPLDYLPHIVRLRDKLDEMIHKLVGKKPGD